MLVELNDSKAARSRFPYTRICAYGYYNMRLSPFTSLGMTMRNVEIFIRCKPIDKESFTFFRLKPHKKLMRNAEIKTFTGWILKKKISEMKKTIFFVFFSLDWWRMVKNRIENKNGPKKRSEYTDYMCT